MDTNMSIPDFDDMLELVGTIKKLSIEAERLKLKIKDNEATTVIEMTTNPEHFINGKPPSMSFLRDTFKFSGLDGSLLDLRQSLAKSEAELEFARNELEIYRSMIEVWRTVSANRRASIN